MRFWFQVWYRQDDGRSYAYVDGHSSLGDAQRAWSGVAARMEGASEQIVAAGLSALHCPSEGPWPRGDGAGRRPLLVRAPEAAVEVAS